VDKMLSNPADDTRLITTILLWQHLAIPMQGHLLHII